MSRRPIILTVAFKRPFSTFTYMGVQMSDNHHVYGVISDVCHMASRVLGFTPLLVSTITPNEEIPHLVRMADGIIISGGNSNINPKLYGQTPAHARQFFDDDRDRLEKAILEAAIAQKVPTLMICRGMQLLNVHFGGTLKQEIKSNIDHNCSLSARNREATEAFTHDLSIKPGSELSKWLRGAVQHLRVNSVHEQAIDRLGDGFAVEATAPDGTIEAIRYTRCPQFLYGVQWHPDYNAELPASRAVLDAFGDEVKKHAKGKGLKQFLPWL